LLFVAASCDFEATGPWAYSDASASLFVPPILQVASFPVFGFENEDRALPSWLPVAGVVDEFG
jgi:hypothetical protein